YKQLGQDAILANNVFFYATYDGAVNIDKIQDPVQRRAVQDQVAYFGQTPSRLLIGPHARRMSLSDVLHMKVSLFPSPLNLHVVCHGKLSTWNFIKLCLVAKLEFLILTL
ncbi:WD40 repeat family protein, partial [Tanacetum coccineum]